MAKKVNIKKPANKQISAVEQFGLTDVVLQKYKEGMPAYKISEWILENKKIKISNVSISKWLKKNKTAMQTKVATDLQSLGKFESMCTNYEQEIKLILDEVKDMKDIAKQNEDLDVYVKLVGKLYQGLELLAKLMGDLKPAQDIDINIIVDKINELHFQKNKNCRNLSSSPIVDVEAEIFEEDLERENKLKEEAQ
jgi:hypothetical protein